MTSTTTPTERRIVTCDGCGNPFAALRTDEEFVLVTDGGGGCPTCGGTEFSGLSL